MKFRSFFTFIKKVAASYSADRVASLSAGLAYYTIFSLAPILLICIAFMGAFLGQEAVQGQIFTQLKGLLGADVAAQVQLMVENANRPSSAFWAKVFGFVLLFIGASGVFSEIQSGLNIIWEVPVKSKAGWWTAVKQRLLSFTIVLIIAFLLLVSFLTTTVLTTIGSYLTQYLGFQVINLALIHLASFGLALCLFAMIYKILPDANIMWKEVWLGAFITALLFTLGKYLLSYYLANAQFTSSYGAAGALVALLIWVYYSAQIFFIGAEITYVYCLGKGVTKS